jgi:hypothetical protein
MPGLAQIILHLVKPQRLHDAERVALAVETLLLQRLVHAAERHHAGLGAERLEEIGGDLAARGADLQPGEIGRGLDRPHARGDVVKPVLPGAAEGVQARIGQLAADAIAERAVERRENLFAVIEHERH